MGVKGVIDVNNSVKIENRWHLICKRKNRIGFVGTLCHRIVIYDHNHLVSLRIISLKCDLLWSFVKRAFKLYLCACVLCVYVSPCSSVYFFATGKKVPEFHHHWSFKIDYYLFDEMLQKIEFVCTTAVNASNSMLKYWIAVLMWLREIERDREWWRTGSA